ncbi:hypothetical protein [Massilia antarctica]|uniref:hypothetical protein n=1 Tax=Massilia antarctica TaxID=2765360 RepID=UPI0022721BFE|nr:hypothetical protein [Massilia sp. H27-R4]MCY0915469.1 hypothetical protein [Massilia sp. H27-R4]
MGRTKVGKAAKPKPVDSASKPAKAPPKSAANTTRTVYLDAAWKSAACDSDRGTAETKCKDKPDHQKKDEKTRKGGLIRLVRDVTAGVDKIGRANYGYDKTKPIGNEWMDDHCAGMWVKPQFTGLDEAEVAKYKKDLDKFGDTVDSYLKNPGKIVKASYEQLSRQAVDKFGYESVRNMVVKKVGVDALIAAVPGPAKAGALAKMIAIGKAGFSAASYVDTAKTLATALATDHAQELLRGMEYMVGEKKERLVELQKVWKDKPDRVMAELMSINGEFDACLRARKCHFTPYRNTSKENAKKGRGCCPGQTPHHVIPDSAVKDAKCKGYNHDGGLTICLEGQDNNAGSHGRAHNNLNDILDTYNGVKKPPKPISYSDMRGKALDALKDQTEQCKEACLIAQLNEYYVDCKDLIAKSGKGGAIPKDDVGTGVSND